MALHTGDQQPAVAPGSIHVRLQLCSCCMHILTCMLHVSSTPDLTLVIEAHLSPHARPGVSLQSMGCGIDVVTYSCCVPGHAAHC